jgi:type IX secretion system PorP/SprF family membrane protein
MKLKKLSGKFKWSTTLVLLWVICIFGNAVAQEALINNNFYLNPFFFNPGFAGSDNRPVVNIGYRKQWVGIKGAPAVGMFSFHSPIGENLSLGSNITNDSRGMLNTSNLQFALAYKVPFSYNHFIRFGISAGAGFNQIDGLSEILNDPRYANDAALIDAVDNNIYLDGRFGVQYHLGNLNLGFTLPRLFDNTLVTNSDFNQGQINPTSNYQLNGSYRFEISKDVFAIEPFLLYEITQSESNNRIEAAALFHLGKSLWIGGGYRQQQGPLAVGGIKVADRFSVGYTFELAPDYLQGFTSGSHEVQLKLAFGEERKVKKPAVKKEDTKKTDPYLDYLKNKENEVLDDNTTVQEPVNRKSSDLIGEKGEVTNYDGPVIVNRGNHLLELAKGYYVIAGVFNDFQKAEEYSDWLFIQGYFTKYGYISQSGYYYVFIYYSLADGPGAEKERERLSARSFFSKAWVLTVE